MLVIIMLVSFAPLILVSATILYQFQVSYHERVCAHLEELVQKHKQNIDNFLLEKLGNIRVLAKTFSFEELRDESFLQDRLEDLQRAYNSVFVDLGVVNERGVQVAYAGPFKLGKALYSEADWFNKAINNSYFISDVFMGLRGLPHFIVTVRDNWKGQSWILRATIDFVAFNNLVENIHLGKTGFAFILNRQGEYQTKALHEMMPNNRRLYASFLEGQGRTEKKVFVGEMQDEAGKRNIYAAAFMKGGEWLLVYQQRYSDAFSDFHKTFLVTAGIFLLGGFGIVSMALLLSKRMVSRIAGADQEAEKMNEQIVETGKLASVGELAAGIAHEINNPVAIMVEEAGWIGDLLEEEEFGESENLKEFSRAVEQIQRQGNRCKEITHKLLSFARKTDSGMQDIDVNELVEEIVSLSAQRAKYSNVSVDINLQRDLPHAGGSQSELQQVFLNLINNALDAMGNKGGRLQISSSIEDKNIVVEISDNGPGIPQANLSRIFDPFFTTKPVGKGTGLGLSICYGIIKKMGGEIDVHSVVQKGSTFRVRIPSSSGTRNRSV
jgi:two-component system NtrC family sensor kinase